MSSVEKAIIAQLESMQPHLLKLVDRKVTEGWLCKICASSEVSDEDCMCPECLAGYGELYGEPNGA